MKNKFKLDLNNQKQKIKRFVSLFSRSKITLVIAGLLLLILITLLIGFILPKNIQYAFTPKECFFNPILLPGSVGVKPSKSFTASFEDKLSVFNFDLFSATTCVSPTAPPNQGGTETVFLGQIIKKSIHIHASKPPVLNLLTKVDAPISPSRSVDFELAAADTFNYRLQINSKIFECKKEANKIGCDLEPFKLSQTKKYKLTLKRYFATTFVADVLSQEFTTTAAIKVLRTSIKQNAKVFNKPTQITVDFDKTIAHTTDIKLYQVVGKNAKHISVKTSFTGKKLSIKFAQLSRQSNFKLTLAKVDATDGGFLDKPYTLKFKTSGGPTVTSAYVPNTPGSSFTLTFDSEIAKNQNLNNYFVVEHGGKRVSASVYLNGKRVTIKPRSTLPVCSSFKLKVLDGFKSKYGISGGSAWHTNRNTLCRFVISIGTSVQGRSILAYKYGNGPKKVVFVGGIHGNEQSSTYILNSLIAYLDQNPWQVPRDRTVIIIPTANPDGYAANNRCNAHNVDLNRNFPTGDWKSKVDGPGCSKAGSKALSEPESRALANYVSSVGARIVLSYHAVAGIVAANEAGNSLSLARTYGQKSGYPSYGSEADDIYFDYDTTGAFEDWMGERGIPGILIELRSNYGNEFYTHLDAMLAMIRNS